MRKQVDEGLVSAKEVASVINVDKYGFIGTFIGWLLMKHLKNLIMLLFQTKYKLMCVYQSLTVTLLYMK